MDVEAVVHREVFGRHNPGTRFSHFEGSPRMLKCMTVMAWERSRYERCACARELYAVRLTPLGFICKVDRNKAEFEVDWKAWDRGHFDRSHYFRVKNKQTAASAFALVEARESNDGPHGHVLRLVIIDLQAFPEDYSAFPQ